MLIHSCCCHFPAAVASTVYIASPELSRALQHEVDSVEHVQLHRVLGNAVLSGLCKLGLTCTNELVPAKKNFTALLPNSEAAVSATELRPRSSASSALPSCKRAKNKTRTRTQQQAFASFRGSEELRQAHCSY